VAVVDFNICTSLGAHRSLFTYAHIRIVFENTCGFIHWIEPSVGLCHASWPVDQGYFAGTDATMGVGTINFS
jgi:hypothetical protein